MENLELRNEVQSKTSDVIRLEDLLDKIQIDKRRLTQRVNKLTANGQCVIKPHLQFFLVTYM